MDDELKTLGRLTNVGRPGVSLTPTSEEQIIIYLEYSGNIHSYKKLLGKNKQLRHIIININIQGLITYLFTTSLKYKIPKMRR